MNLEILVLFVIAMVAGIAIGFFLVRMSFVSRKKYDEVRENQLASENKLQNKEEMESELRKLIKELSTKNESLLGVNNTLEKEITKINTNLNHLQLRFDEAQQNLDEMNDLVSNKDDEVIKLKNKISEISNDNKYLNEKIEAKSEEFHELRKKSLVEFENIASKLFEDNSNKFSKLSKDNIETILNPLKENLTEFKKKVEETYDKESKERFSLQDRIKELVALNQQISNDANNLTKALKGEAKTQGNWGEMILESILENSGLVKNREYFVQESYQDSNGKRKQPDVTIKYPDNRYIIVDSKVSLTAYERFVNADDPERQKIHLADHITSLKNHIDNLSSKEYDKITKSLDFVMLFVPIEPAYMTAIQFDSMLWDYAYKKRILLISPTNLIAALKMVADIWKREHQNENAEKIAKRGEAMLEKFAGFLEDFKSIENHISKLSDSYNSALNKLSEGKGNLISQAEKLKELGLKPKKQIPEDLNK